MYIPVANLSREYIQSLISRCGFTDVSDQYPDWGLYSIQDLDGNIMSFMGMDSVRRWLVEQAQLQNPYAGSVLIPTDQNYPDGTVVCPSSNSLAQCTHDNCPYAVVYASGAANSAGSINVKTAFDILPRTHVVSDGRGGVRAAAPGELAFVLGFSTNQTSSAQVNIILRSYFGVVS